MQKKINAIVKNNPDTKMTPEHQALILALKRNPFCENDMIDIINVFMTLIKIYDGEVSNYSKITYCDLKNDSVYVSPSHISTTKDYIDEVVKDFLSHVKPKYVTAFYGECSMVKKHLLCYSNYDFESKVLNNGKDARYGILNLLHGDITPQQVTYYDIAALAVALQNTIVKTRKKNSTTYGDDDYYFINGFSKQGYDFYNELINFVDFEGSSAT